MQALGPPTSGALIKSAPGSPLCKQGPCKHWACWPQGSTSGQPWRISSSEK